MLERSGLVEREGHPGAGFGAEPLGRLADISAAEFYVELSGPLVVGQGPNEKRTIAVLGQVLAGHLEKPRAESQPLKFRGDIKFENLPAIMQRRHAIASIACIAADGFIEIQDQKARSPQNGRVPPAWPAARDHPFELAAGNKAAISVAPR